MNNYPKLTYGHVYHIFNRGINGMNLFLTHEDNKHFLKIYERYIEPIADTYAWCLLQNHFHLLVKIKHIEDIGYFHPLYHTNLNKTGQYKDISEEYKWAFITEKEAKNFTGISKNKLIRPTPYRQFSHFFNAYSKYINSKYGRTGSLFEKNFRRIQVGSPFYFRQLIMYIHKNPQKHGFTDNFRHYSWSSFHSILSIKPTKLKRDTVLGWFDDEANFIELHSNEPASNQLTDFLFE
jgi:putative transposase